jgi:hypothetical protein
MAKEAMPLGHSALDALSRRTIVEAKKWGVQLLRFQHCDEVSCAFIVIKSTESLITRHISFLTINFLCFIP